MRRFETTPLKKLAGMVILFVFIPLFLVWYWVFFLGHRPGVDTSIIIACAVLLLVYSYLKYRRQLKHVGPQQVQAEEEFPEEGLAEETPVEEAEEEFSEETENDETLEQELKKPVNKQK